jgi:addiction module HigA family antidote
MGRSRTKLEFPTRRASVARIPTHPGAILGLDVLPALNMSVSEAAVQMRVTRQTLHRIISGRTAVTPEMAVRLGKFCGNGPGLWLRLQEAYDLWHAMRKLKDELSKIPTVRAA